MIKTVVWEVMLSICGVCLILAAASLFFVAVYPFDVFDVKTPMKVISKKVHQGDCIFVVMDYDQKVYGPSIITAQVITKENIMIASTLLGLNLPTGKHVVKVGFMLPRNINLASKKRVIRAKLLLTSRFEVLGFRNIDTTYCTEDFDIILNGDSHDTHAR